MKIAILLMAALPAVALAPSCGGNGSRAVLDAAQDGATDVAISPGTGGAAGGGGVRETGGIASGGSQGSGGGAATGGTVATGGAASGGSGPGGGAGGRTGTGGAVATGGALATGGSTVTGGSGTSSGGASARGGSTPTGGSNGVGGTGGRATGGAGGAAATGGVTTTGGVTSTGGIATGGVTSTGGIAATGGMNATGGVSTTGGITSRGGAGGTGATGGSTSITWDFPSDTEGWSGGFADYPPGIGTGYDLEYGWAALPPEVGPGGGLRLNGNNHSDDLFMYVMQPIAGLLPQTTYLLDVVAVVDTNAPADCGGIGGSPGTSVFVKIGAVTLAPTTSTDSQGRLTLNVDKGNQSVGGADMKVVGNLGNTRTCPDQTYQPKTFTLSAFSVKSAADGTLWVLLGTDSGFEGITTLYYDRIAITLTPSR